MFTPTGLATDGTVRPTARTAVTRAWCRTSFSQRSSDIQPNRSEVICRSPENLQAISVNLPDWDTRSDHLLSIHSAISVPLLRIDPTWDTLRHHPRFPGAAGAVRVNARFPQFVLVLDVLLPPVLAIAFVRERRCWPERDASDSMSSARARSTGTAGAVRSAPGRGGADAAERDRAEGGAAADGMSPHGGPTTHVLMRNRDMLERAKKCIFGDAVREDAGLYTCSRDGYIDRKLMVIWDRWIVEDIRPNR